MIINYLNAIKWQLITMFKTIRTSQLLSIDTKKEPRSTKIINPKKSLTWCWYYRKIYQIHYEVQWQKRNIIWKNCQITQKKIITIITTKYQNIRTKL